MSTDKEMIYDLIICGGGPSGLAAGMYAGRTNMNVLLIEKGLLGGVLNITERIDNYLGFHGGINGMALAAVFEKHMRRYVPEENVIFEEIVELTVDPHDSCIKHVKTTENTYKGHAVIIGSGSTPKLLEIPDHNKWYGRGLSYCAICDGAFYNGKPLAVVGGGNAAIEEGIFLTRFATEVTIIHRRNELRATKILQEEALNHPKMKFAWDSVPVMLHGEPALQEIEIENVKTKEHSRLKANGLFVYIGSTPNTGFVNIHGIRRDEGGYIHTDENMNIGVPGVFATGDVRAFPLRQISISAGNGSIAALMAEKYLAELKRDHKYCGRS
jgi:thioredoxin reductase (NADPH)